MRAPIVHDGGWLLWLLAAAFWARRLPDVMALEIVLSVLATFHMLVAGVASAAPLVVSGLRCSSGIRQADPAPLRDLAWLSLVSLVVAAVVGLAAGYLRYTLGEQTYGEMLERFPARFYLTTTIEWFFALLCYGGWYAAWKWGTRHPWWHLLIAVVGATNLLYHFPPLMTLQRILAERPETIAEAMVTRSLSLQVLSSGEVIAHTLHFYALAAAVSFAMLLFLSAKSAGANSSRLRRVAGWGGLGATAAQMLTGVALVALLPGSKAEELSGGAALPTLGFAGGVVLSLALVAVYARVAFGLSNTRGWRQPIYLTFGATLLMAIATRVGS